MWRDCLLCPIFCDAVFIVFFLSYLLPWALEIHSNSFSIVFQNLGQNCIKLKIETDVSKSRWKFHKISYQFWTQRLVLFKVEITFVFESKISFELKIMIVLKIRLNSKLDLNVKINLTLTLHKIGLYKLRIVFYTRILPQTTICKVKDTKTGSLQYSWQNQQHCMAG